jgi:hypothetical protein
LLIIVNVRKVRDNSVRHGDLVAITYSVESVFSCGRPPSALGGIDLVGRVIVSEWCRALSPFDGISRSLSSLLNPLYLKNKPPLCELDELLFDSAGEG